MTAFLRAALGAVTVLTVSLLAAQPAAAEDTGSDQTTVDNGSWRRLAQATYGEASPHFQQFQVEGKKYNAQYSGALVAGAAKLYGWRDKQTRYWLDDVKRQRHPDGGWGVSYAWDPFGDGTVNDESTTYTITTAWHIGRVLIPGYDKGAVPAGLVRDAVTSVLDTPTVEGEKCAAYSNNPNDATMPCVWNVSAAAAWFVKAALDRHLVPTDRVGEADAKWRAWYAYVEQNYRADLGGWTYQSDTTTLQDAWHNAPTVWVAVNLDRTFGKDALAGHLSNWPDTSGANVDLLPYACSHADGTYPAAFKSATLPIADLAARVGSRLAYPGAAAEVDSACR